MKVRVRPEEGLCIGLIGLTWAAAYILGGHSWFIAGPILCALYVLALGRP